MYDVIIVGAGPAGLSAGLILGRCRRTVLICDSGEFRNAASHSMHGFLSRDGMRPAEFLRVGREQLEPYGVEVRKAKVTDARRSETGFEITVNNEKHEACKKLLLATGVIDRIPPVKGIQDLYGRSVFHCPYCDGWELRDQALAVYGRAQKGLDLALALTTWSDDVVLCTDGRSWLSGDDVRLLTRRGIKLNQERIDRLEGRDGILERIVFKTGASLPRRGLFLSTGMEQRSDLPARLGCSFSKKGGVKTFKLEESRVPGLYVAGDASRDVQLVIVAAAEGAKAAFSINAELRKEKDRE
ncbi:MAG TPA: NAD(P)/FAD-dependent oxidoreductase [Candidatus Binatia bacterium]|nr:NAD(P)/FAD-dependent oxidoreductase [Candidatus Binatia bacterium]